MADAHTVLGTWLLGVLEQFESQHIPMEQLADAQWLREASARNPTGQLKMVAVRRLWHQAMRLGASPLLGLQVGLSLPMQAMNVTAWLVIHSPSLREGLRHALRYQSLLSNSGRFDMVEQPQGALLLYRVTPSPVAMHPAQVDSVFAGTLRLLRSCRSALLRPTALALPGATPSRRTDYERLLACDVTESRGDPCMAFAAADLDRPVAAADPQLLQLALRRAQDLLHAQSRTESLVDHVQASILSRGCAQADCAAIAADLCVSVRTLQRRLEACGTNYRRILEATRMEEAMRLLSGGTPSLTAIADMLGYADLSALSHAVRTHWGTSPRELRAELAGVGAGESRRSLMSRARPLAAVPGKLTRRPRQSVA